MNLKGTPILVTGAGGFIGSHLCEELVRLGANVRALVRYNSRQSYAMLDILPKDVQSQIEVMPGDIRDSDLVTNVVRGCAVVFHLAALIGIPYSYHAPRSYLESNAFGTLNVLQACLAAGVERLVHTSTSEVYGTAKYTPMDENHPLQAQSPYSASKIAADKLAESFFLSFDLPVVTIRPFNCYGPRQSARAFIPAMVSQALSRAEVFCGSLNPIRDYTFVKDTTAAFIACAQKPNIEGLTINVGSGTGFSMGDVLQRIIERTGLAPDIVRSKERVRSEKSEVRQLVCDNSRARDLLAWEPTTPLNKGLDETIEYVRINLDSFRTTLYVV